MRLKTIAIGVAILLSNSVSASNFNNPFVMPSQRDKIQEIGIEMIRVSLCEEQKQEMSSDGNSLVNLLAGEIGVSQSVDPMYHPDVLGKWTRQDIDESRFVGNINGFKTYYHPTKKVYIKLDLSKADKE